MKTATPQTPTPEKEKSGAENSELMLAVQEIKSDAHTAPRQFVRKANTGQNGE